MHCKGNYFRPRSAFNKEGNELNPYHIGFNYNRNLFFALCRTEFFSILSSNFVNFTSINLNINNNREIDRTNFFNICIYLKKNAKRDCTYPSTTTCF